MTGALGGADLAAVVATGVAVAVVAATVVVLVRLLAVLRELAATVDHLRRETEPLVAHLADAVTETEEQLDRVDQLVGSAEQISATVDATSRIAYRALSAPVIKTVAATTGASRAARRLRRPVGDDGD